MWRSGSTRGRFRYARRMTHTNTDRTVVSRINLPLPFGGTEEERRVNYDTHRFYEFHGEIRCDECDCRPGHRAASYPCGYRVPRYTVVRYSDGTVEEDFG